jgi:hypothetical protein
MMNIAVTAASSMRLLLLLLVLRREKVDKDMGIEL